MSLRSAHVRGVISAAREIISRTRLITRSTRLITSWEGDNYLAFGQICVLYIAYMGYN